MSDDHILMDELRGMLPPEIACLSLSEQNHYLQQVIEKFQLMEKAEKQRAREVSVFVESVKAYTPKHPSVYDFSATFLHPDLAEALKDGSPAALDRVMTELSPRIYLVPFFTTEFCELLVDEIHNFHEWAARDGVKLPRPNSMNNYGLVLQHTGFSDFLSQITSRVVSPMATHSFSDVGGATLDSQHGFLVEYEIGNDRHLDVHVDDSEVTTNVCLGSQFSGGSLFFENICCDRHQQVPLQSAQLTEVAHRVGYAVVHTGRHRHGALPIDSGHRLNLVVWHRSSQFRRDADYRVCPLYCAFHPTLPAARENLCLNDDNCVQPAV